MNKFLLIGVWMLLLSIVTCGNTTKETGDIDTTSYDNMSFEEKNSALIKASGYGGDLEIVKYLVEKGADVNAKSDRGDTALMFASEKGHTEIVEYLESLK